MSVNEKMTAIADAIRGKTGKSAPLTLDQMATEIAGIQVGGGSGGDDNAFLSVLELTAADLILPNGLVNLKVNLQGMSKLKSVSFPDTLETISQAVFAYTQALDTPIVFPASLKSIGKNCFNSCYRIPSVTFKGKPESIDSQAFNGAVRKGVINCPWSEGEVAGAPWGATSATINYNYTGG